MLVKLVNIHEAKTHLSRLVDQAAAGQPTIIGKAGKPVARLVPFREDRSPRRPGRWAGRVTMAPDFDDTPAEVIEAFEGG